MAQSWRLETSLQGTEESFHEPFDFPWTNPTTVSSQSHSAMAAASLGRIALLSLFIDTEVKIYV
jgi:hypothetical protein